MNAEKPTELEIRTAYWRRMFDMGYHGHAEGNRDRWVTAQLVREGLVTP